MLALLGMVAVAGYQNRDKLGDILKPGGTTDANAEKSGGENRGIGGIISDIASTFSGPGAGGNLANGLGELVDRFKRSGAGDIADSWVADGPNKNLQIDQLERAIGTDTVAELSKKTGLSREELLARLATNVPDAVDHLTPRGRLPSEQEASQFS